MSTFRRYVAAPLTEGRAPRALAFLAAGIPLGTAWFVMLVTGWTLGLGLLITLLGLPVLLLLSFAARGAARLERHLADGLLGTRLAGRERPVRSGSFLQALWDWVRDPASWREQAYLLLRFALGLPLGIVALAVPLEGLRSLTLPLHYWAWDAHMYGAWDIDTFGEALVGVAIGAALLLVSVPLVTGLGSLWAVLARVVLGDGAARPAGERRRGRPLSPAGPPSVRATRGLRAHALVYATLNAALIVIWALSTPGGYFWPVWPMLVLGLILGVRAVWALTPALLPEAGPRVVGLGRHGAVAGVFALFLTLVWAVTTPGGTFWPVWAFIGLAATVALNAAIMAVAGGRREAEATERIEALQSSRAGAVDAQAAELRRIERDLHDGAQARLVALAMDLGMAKERVDDEQAREQVARAHKEAKRAIVELRDLARGIHPAVLTDRGLEAALGSLAGTSRVPVVLHVEPHERLDPPLEAAAYFVVAEALANAAKHSGANAVRVDLSHHDGLLRVRVADDGAGGADSEGDGLTGLRRRVEAHDGTLTVESPPGGGTTLTAELPCAS